MQSKYSEQNRMFYENRDFHSKATACGVCHSLTLTRHCKGNLVGKMLTFGEKMQQRVTQAPH